MLLKHFNFQITAFIPKQCILENKIALFYYQLCLNTKI